MLYRALLFLGILAAAAGLLWEAERVTATGQRAVSLCTQLLIPSLFPFFVVSTLLVQLGYADALGRVFGPVMRTLFRVNGRCAAAFLLGAVGGYPVGARTAIALYREGACSRTEAERLLAFCSNSGPAFVLGTVGSLFGAGVSGLGGPGGLGGLGGLAGPGLRLYATHLAASVLIGIGFRFWRYADGPSDAVLPAASHDRVSALPAAGPAKEPTSFSSALVRSVSGAVIAVAKLCGFVVLFAVLTELLFASGTLTWLAKLAGTHGADLGLTPAMAEALLRGFLEVTSGLWSLAGARGSLTAQLALAACMLGWAGLCVHCQVLTFLEGSDLSARPYLAGKLLQGLLSAALMALFSRLAPFPAETALLLAARLQTLSQLRPPAALLSSLTGSLAVLWAAAVMKGTQEFNE